MNRFSQIFLVFFLALMMLPSLSHACTNPAGVEGEVIHNDTHNVPTYCDGTNWIAMSSGDDYYIPNAVNFNFNNVNNRLVEPAGLVGIQDSKKITVSFWFKDNEFGTSKQILNLRQAGAGGIQVGMTASGQILFIGKNSVGTQIKTFKSNSNSSTGWRHIMFSFDLSDIAKTYIYTDDVSDIFVLIRHVDDFLDFTDTLINVANNDTKFDIADFWIDLDTTIDLSIEANRRKFIDASGNPVYLGENGELPLGTSPDLFLSGDTADWHTNKGTGGGLTEDGTLIDAATMPYTPRTQIVPSGLIAHWRMDETSGTTAFDSTRNGYDLSLSAGLTTNSVSGQVGNAFDYFSAGNGSNGTVTLPTSVTQNKKFTISMWLKQTEKLSGQQGLFESQSWNNISLLFGGTVSFGAPATTTGGTEYGPTLDLGKWTHIAVTYDYDDPLSTSPIFYKNGILDTGGWNTAPTGTYSAPPAQTVFIGRRWNSSSSAFRGEIDDVRLYDRVLNETEIQEIYGATNGIRYNADQKIPEYFDGNKLVPMRPDFAEPIDKPLYGLVNRGCPTIGDTCTDGTVYAGESLGSGGTEKTYVTATNQGSAVWTNPEGINDISTVSTTDGRINVANLTSHISNFPAFTRCANLTDHGHDDWYLPAESELVSLDTNEAAINAGSTQIFWSGPYWSSTQLNNELARRRYFASNSTNQLSKENNHQIRCIRRDSFGNIGTAGLVGHWKLDEKSGGTALDSSGNGNNGTMTSGMNADDNSAVGAVATSLNFNSNLNQKIALGDVNALNFTDENQFTISMWMNSFSRSTTPTLFHRGTGTGLNGSYRFGNYLGQDRFLFNIIVNDSGLATESVLTPTGTWKNNQWQHVVAVYTGSEMYVYVDNVLAGSNTSIEGVLYDYSTVPVYRLTSIGGDGRYSALPFDGALDDVRAYNRALSVAEINQLYQMGAPIGSVTSLPQGCPTIGDVCDDGTVYAGLSPDGNVAMYTTPNDIPTKITWHNGNGSGQVATSVTDNITGAANTAAIVRIDADSVSSGFQPHQAAQACYDLNYGGADDWYLPARDETTTFFTNRDAIGGFIIGGSEYYWSSTESTATTAQGRRLTDGYGQGRTKGEFKNARCVRKGPAPRCANPYGLEGQMTYNTKHDVVQYCDGARWIGIGKYETSVPD